MATTRTSTSAALLVALSCSVACGHSTHYQRQSADPEELIWQVEDGDILVQRGPAVVARDNTWDGIVDAVSCVPEAVAFAEEAETNGFWGQFATWGGIGLLIASPLVGVGTGITSAVGIATLGAGNPLAIGGGATVGILVGSGFGLTTFAGGYTALLVGSDLIRRSIPNAVDAVNVYNDSYAITKTCQR